jgi:hypothetical protein
MTPNERNDELNDEIFRRRLFRARVTAFSLGALLGALLIGIIWRALSKLAAYSGDTPVVLVGGSMTVKVGSSDPNLMWNSYSNGYRTSTAHAVTEIALKRDYKPDDNDDKHRDTDDNQAMDLGSPISVTSAAPWTVDLYKTGSTDPSLRISVNPPALDYQLTVLDDGILCRNSNRRIAYSTGDCTGDNQKKVKFSQAVVTTNVGTTTLNCIDTNNQQGSCRIVLRYPSNP